MSLTSNSADAHAARTPAIEPAAISAAAVAASLCSTYHLLAERTSLRPRPTVDALFGQLVGTVLSTPDDDAREVLEHATLRTMAPSIRDLCARGETELELEWAARICASASPHAELARFPYLDNYRQLSRMEIGVLASAVARPIREVAFVGSGPLPLSALHLAEDLKIAVDCFDRDPDAIATARRVADHLSFTSLHFQRADAADADLSGYDVVVVGALVGATPEEKREILARMRQSMDPGAILLARSARGLRTLLYPPVDLDALPGFDLLTVIHPVDEVINSVVLARVRREGE